MLTLPWLKSMFLLLAVVSMAGALACETAATKDTEVTDTKTFTWEFLEGHTLSWDTPADWEWDEINNARVAESGDWEILPRYVQVQGKSKGDLPYAVIGYEDGPIDEWVILRKEVTEESEAAIHHSTWNGKVNGVKTIFERTDHDQSALSLENSRTLTAFIMPEGNDWAWRVICSAGLTKEADIKNCEALVESVRLE